MFLYLVCLLSWSVPTTSAVLNWDDTSETDGGEWLGSSGLNLRHWVVTVCHTLKLINVFVCQDAPFPMTWWDTPHKSVYQHSSMRQKRAPSTETSCTVNPKSKAKESFCIQDRNTRGSCKLPLRRTNCFLPMCQCHTSLLSNYLKVTVKNTFYVTTMFRVDGFPLRLFPRVSVYSVQSDHLMGVSVTQFKAALGNVSIQGPFIIPPVYKCEIPVGFQATTGTFFN